MKKFIEYTHNGELSNKMGEDMDFDTERDIKLYCDHEKCKQYIKGYLGYNGGFTSETGQSADLRNQSWMCSKHHSY